jgi:hypothetical protein
MKGFVEIHEAAIKERILAEGVDLAGIADARELSLSMSIKRTHHMLGNFSEGLQERVGRKRPVGLGAVLRGENKGNIPDVGCTNPT